jgi:hypothetical protein
MSACRCVLSLLCCLCSFCFPGHLTLHAEQSMLHTRQSWYAVTALFVA